MPRRGTAPGNFPLASPPWLSGLALYSLDTGRPPMTPSVGIAPSGIVRKRHDRRVVDSRSQGQLGRAEQKRVGSEKGGRQFDHGAWRRHRPRVELTNDGLPDVGEDARKEPTQGNPGRVEDIHETGQSNPEPAAGFGQGFESDFVAAIGRREKVGHGYGAAERIPARPAKQGFLANFGLPATAAAAVAEIAVGVHGQMSDLACIPGRPTQRQSADDETGADAAFTPQTYEVVRATARPPQMRGGRGQIGVVSDEHRKIQIAEALAN